jgi:hypothetical protein
MGPGRRYDRDDGYADENRLEKAKKVQEVYPPSYPFYSAAEVVNLVAGST